MTGLDPDFQTWPFSTLQGAPPISIRDAHSSTIYLQQLPVLLQVIPILHEGYKNRESFFQSIEGEEIHFGIQARSSGQTRLSDDPQIRNVQRVSAYLPLIVDFQRVLDDAFAASDRSRAVHILGDVLHDVFEASLAFDDDDPYKSREADTEAYVFYELKMRVFLKCLQENEPELFLDLIQGGYRVPGSTRVISTFDRSWLSSSFVQNLEHLPHGTLLSREVDIETLDRMATLETFIAANAVAMGQFTPGRSRAVHQYVLRYGERPLRAFVRAEAPNYRQRLNRFVVNGDLLAAMDKLYQQPAGPIPMQSIQRIANHERLTK